MDTSGNNNSILNDSRTYDSNNTTNSHNIDNHSVDNHSVDSHDTHIINNQGLSGDDVAKVVKTSMQLLLEEERRRQQEASAASYSRDVNWSKVDPIPGSEQYRPHSASGHASTPQTTIVYASSPRWPIVLVFIAVIVAAAIVIAFMGKGSQKEEKAVVAQTEVVSPQPQQQVTAPAQKTSPAKKASQTTASSTVKSSTPARQTTTAQPQTTNAYSSAPVQTVEQPQTVTPKVNPFDESKAKADAGDAASCYKVAMAYKDGNGVGKNLSLAFNYMKTAADKGYTPAYIEVAKMYHGGRGVTKDRNVAEQWYQKAANAGSSEAKRILLNM